MTTVEHFWSIYEKMEFSERKFYEVLSEKPVKLYFDLGKGMLLVKKRKICYIKSSFNNAGEKIVRTMFKSEVYGSKKNS